MKKLLCIALSLMLVLGAASALAETIKIGGIAPLSGPVAVYGVAVQNAVEMYVEDVNAKGGVLGMQVEVEWLDDKHDPTEANNAYMLLADNKELSAILGPVTSAPVLAIVDMAGEDGIPLVTPTGTADVITSYGYDNVFRACFKDSFQGTVMAVFASGSLGAKKAAVLYDNTSDYSSGIAENFVKKAEELGLEIVAYEACVAGSSDYRVQLTNIAATDAECLFVPMYYNDVSLICAQAQEIGIEAPLLGVDGWDGIFDVVEDPSIFDGYYFCNHSAADDTTPASVAFRAAYAEKYGEQPNALACLGYDGITVLLDAIERAGTATDWPAIIAEIRNTKLEGISGYIEYDENGDPASKSAVIIIIEDGAFKFYERVNP